MFNFFKKKGKYPDFRILNSFHRKNFYLLRNAEWASVDDENILVTDPATLGVYSFNQWPRAVFVSANGETTVEQFIYFMADQYPEKIPNNLDHVIIFEIFELEKKGLILLSKEKQVPPKEFNLPGLIG